VRCHLHYVAGRAEERLTFDLQPRSRGAWATPTRGTRGVERFMKHYFLVAKDVGDLTRIFCTALEIEPSASPAELRRWCRGPRRSAASGRRENGVSTSRADAFDKDPVNFLRLFKFAQEHDLDIHPATRCA
jgi:[protein-PII] uridylyltransferase